jgi:hypothetical protein
MSAAIMQAPNLEVNVRSGNDSKEHAYQLDLKMKDFYSPIYKLRQFQQTQGGSALNLSATSNTQSYFNIPGDMVLNFAKSYLTLDMLYFGNDNAGGNLYGTATVNSVFTDSIPMHAIQLRAGSTVLADLQEVQAYTKVIQPLSIDMEDYFSRGSVYADTGAAAGAPIAANPVIGTNRPISQVSGCNPAMIQPANATTITGRVTAQTAAGVPSECCIIDTAAGTDVAAVGSAVPASGASGSDVAGRAIQRLVSTAPYAGGANNLLNNSICVRYKIPLKAFVGTMLALDRDIYFKQNLQLVVTWKPYSNFGFQTPTNALGQSVVFPITGVPFAAGTQTLVFNNYFMYLAEDVNPDTSGEIKNQVNNEGLSLYIPYTDCDQTTTPAAAGQVAISKTLTNGMGIRLKRCLTIPINPLNTLKMSANTFNVNGVKWSWVQSKLDGKLLQDWQQLMLNSDPWNQLQPLVKRSPAGMSQRTYEENCFWLDNFSDCYDSTHFLENDCFKSGLEIESQKTYDVFFNQTSTAGLILLQYRTFCRQLVIKPNGLAWGSVSGQA